MNIRVILSTFALVAFPACGNLSDVPIFAERVAYTPDGQLVVFTTKATKVYEGDLARETSSIPVEPEFDNWEADSTNLSADGRTASISYGGQARLFGIPGGEPLGAVNAVEPSRSVQYSVLSPGGDLLFLYGGSAPPDAEGHSEFLPGRMYRTTDGSKLWQIPTTLPHEVQYCTFWSFDNPPLFAPDGRTLYVPFTDRLIAVDTLTGTSKVLLTARACISGMTFLADGSLLIHRGGGMTTELRIGNTPPADEAQDESFGIYALDGTLIRELPAFDGYVTQGTWSAQQTPLACASDGATCVMLVAAGALDAERFRDRRGSFLLVFHLDGTLSFPIELDTANVRNVTFSPDGTRIAVAMGVARVYSAADGALLRERKYEQGVF